MNFRNPLISGLAMAFLLSGCGIFSGGKDKSSQIVVEEDMTTAIGVNEQILTVEAQKFGHVTGRRVL